MRLVALIISVPRRASISATLSSYEVCKFCISKMCLVALIMSVPRRASNSATMGSYESLGFYIQKMRLVALIIFGTWELL